MKRLLGSDSDSLLLSEGYGPMMDEDGAEEEIGGGLGCGGGGGGEKKRRLSAEQVRALEKNFEVENKLEPERKARLAQELGLQPRQVAVWFQNRRARWKTKQLERDYGALKARYDALRADRDALLLDKESLLAEVKALKSKVGAGAGVGEESSSFTSVKEEEASPELEEPIAPPTLADDNEPVTVIFTKPDVGSSDSDSSAVVNDADHSPLLTASTATTTTMAAGVDFTHNFFYQTLMKVEDSHGFDVDEPCSSFFSDEPPPTLPWYADHWN